MSCQPMQYGYLGLGSNMGDPLLNLKMALLLLDQHGVRVDGVSPVFRTEPQGLADQNWFANCVVRIQVSSELHPEELLARTMAVEAGLGRERTVRWGPRTMDIDILLLGDRQWESQHLCIPHPRMCERAFVLVPLACLDPDVPILGRRSAHWLSRLTYRVDGDRIYQTWQ